MEFQKKMLSIALLLVFGTFAQTTPATVTIQPSKATLVPNASPLPPVSPTVETFIGDLNTAILYASLIGNDKDLAGLCSRINPPALSNITGINGTAVQREVCASVTVLAQNPELRDFLVLNNQKGVSSLRTALFAVQVIGNYAGGSDLDALCSEIDEDLINRLFINFIDDDFGTTIKNYVCNAAKSKSAAPSPTSRSKFSTTNETCTSPTGSTNKFVRTPERLANTNFYLSDNFSTAHTLFEIVDPNIDLPETVIARFCLEKCIAYRPSGGHGSCLSIFIDQGRPYPPGRLGNDTALRWFCGGFDAPLSGDDYTAVDASDSFLYGLGVNRVCNGTYRAL
ncbi:hypothetical protein MMC29_000529 [Sticta canariensis]|nr:hypothetical protein [Sticta canariensis]